MAGYRKYRRRKPMSASQRAALNHIEQGRRLSAELGGLDREVKQFLFSRSVPELKHIFDEYGRQYGETARLYAESTLPSWRAGQIKMSGLVAERLFKMLPAFMSLSEKLKLAERLWDHTAPSSFKAFVVSPDVNPSELQDMLVKHLEAVVVPHVCPPALEQRFDWLSADDVQVKQHLMNTIRSQEARAVSEAISCHITPLINELNANVERAEVRARHCFKVGKHSVAIDFRHSHIANQSGGCLFLTVLMSAVAGLSSVLLAILCQHFFARCLGPGV